MAVNHLKSSDEELLIDDLLQAEKDTCSTGANSGAEVTKRLIFVSGDVSDSNTGTTFIEEIISAFGRLDIFVSNAGICEFREFLECVYIHIYSPRLWFLFNMPMKDLASFVR